MSDDKTVQKEAATKRLCAFGTVAKAVKDTSKFVGDWSAADLVAGLKVLRKAEAEAKEASDLNDLKKLKNVKDKKLMNELMLWGAYVKASYRKSDAELLKAANIVWSDVLEMSRNVTPIKPAFWVAKHEKEKALVLTVRGSASASDAMSDLAALPAEFYKGKAHQGMVKASGWFVENYKEKLLGFLTEHKLKHVMLLGHSLGGGIASLLSMRLNADKDFKSYKVHAFAYAPPASVSKELSGTSKGKGITSVVLGDDIVPRASLKSFEALRVRLEELNWKRAMVEQALPEQVTKVGAKAGGLLKKGVKAVAEAGKQTKQGSAALKSWDKTLGLVGRSKEQRQEKAAEKEERIDSLCEMFVPGRILHIARDIEAETTSDEDLQRVRVLERKPATLAHIGLADQMVSDHSLDCYLTAIASARAELVK